MKLTAEQAAFRDEIARGTGNLVGKAVAGAGKTTVLVAGAKEWVLANPGKQMIAVAFNKQNQIDLQARMPNEVKCSTLHSVGMRAWQGKLGKRMEVDAGKMGGIVGQILETEAVLNHFESDTRNLYSVMLKMIGLFKANGYTSQILHPEIKQPKYTKYLDETIILDHLAKSGGEEFLDDAKFIHNLIEDAMAASIEMAFEGIIDFDDMVYMPALWKAHVGWFNAVMVDEIQDLNITQILLVQYLAASPGARVIGCGDPHQAIYEFRGANDQAFSVFVETFSAKILSLTYCFRCSKSVVEAAAALVPHIQAPDSAIIGSVTYCGEQWEFNQIQPGDIIICRNNAPLVQVGLKMVREGKSVNFLGGRNVRKLLEKWLKLKETKNLSDLDKIADQIYIIRDKQINDLRNKRRHSAADIIKDTTDCLLAIIDDLLPADGSNEPVPTKSALVRKFDEIFEAQGAIHLSTGHKAKGQEWPTVWFLNQNMLNKSGQDINLRYVILTRAQENLKYIDYRQEQEQDEN